MKDPKFGWHVYWIAPLLMVGSVIGSLIRPFKLAAARKAEKKRRAAWTTETRRMRELAGLDNGS